MVPFVYYSSLIYQCSIPIKDRALKKVLTSQNSFHTCYDKGQRLYVAVADGV